MFNLTLYQTHRIFHPVVKVIAGCVLSVEVQEPVDAIPEERVGTHLSEVLKVVDVELLQRPTVLVEDELGKVYVL